MATKILILLNVLVFGVMCIFGAHPTAPTVASIIKWGGIRSDLVAEGEWWRLFNSMFIHFGFLHLAMNMYFLYSIGRFLEEILGKLHILIIYFSTGLLAGLVSYFAHKNSMITSAGASGAIAGIFGVYIFILLTPLIRKDIRSRLLKNVAQIIGINVIYGLSQGAGIDHAAHLGGLASGFIIGGIFYLHLSGKFKAPRWASGGIALLLPCLLIPTLLKSERPTDLPKFVHLVEEYSHIEDEINAKLGEIDTRQVLAYIELKKEVFPVLANAKTLAAQMKELNLPLQQTRTRDALMQYIELFDTRLRICIRGLEYGPYPGDEQRIQQLTKEIENLVQLMSSS